MKTFWGLFFYYCAWVEISFAHIACAYAVYRWSIFLGDIRRKFFLILASIGMAYGILGLLAAAIGFVGSYYGRNDAFENIGSLGISRLILNMIFPTAVAFILNWVNYHSNRLPEKDKSIVREAVRAFDRLNRIIHQTP